MKTHSAATGSPVRTALCLVLTSAVLLAAPVYANGVKSGQTSAKTGKKKDARPTRVMVTGSNIPEKADRVSGTPTTASPVVIIERSDIERSGRATAAGVLSRHPATR